MSTGYNGSLCLDDLFQGRIVKNAAGKSFVCLDDLSTGPFQKGKTNGKTYVGINVWVNDEMDQFGNIAGVNLQQSKDERERKDKRIYIGNLKHMQQAAAAPTTQAAPAPAGDLPF